MLGNYLQQTTSADDIFRCIFSWRFKVKLAPDLKKNTVYLSSYIPLNEGHPSILTNSMFRTYNSGIDEHIILR